MIALKKYLQIPGVRNIEALDKIYCPFGMEDKQLLTVISVEYVSSSCFIEVDNGEIREFSASLAEKWLNAALLQYVEAQKFYPDFGYWLEPIIHEGNVWAFPGSNAVMRVPICSDGFDFLYHWTVLQKFIIKEYCIETESEILFDDPMEVSRHVLTLEAIVERKFRRLGSN